MRIFLVIILYLASAVVQAMTVMSLNAEWLWDDDPVVEGQIVKSPPTTEAFLGEVEAIAAMARQYDVDVLGLSEIENRNVAETIARRLGDDWNVVFVKGRDTFTGQDVAILTRLKVVPGSVSNFPGFYGNYKDERRVRPSKVVGVMLDGGNQQYFVVNAHLISKRRGNHTKRAAQADAIRKAIDAKAQGASVILMGDFNDTPGSVPLQILQSSGSGLNQFAGPEDVSLTFNGKSELVDHILISSDLAKGSGIDFFTVNADAVSDHRAAVLVMP